MKKDVNYKRIVKALEKWAKQLTSCSHTTCSMSESVYEDVFGSKILEIIEKNK